MRQQGKFLLTVGCVLSVVGSLSAGCGPEPTPTPTPTPTIAPSPTVVGLPLACAAPTEILFVTPFAGPDGTAMEQLVDDFNVLYKDKVHTTFAGISPEDYYDNFATAAGSADLAILPGDRVSTFAYQGLLRPMGPDFQIPNFPDSDYSSGLLKVGNIAGNHYAIPLDIYSLSMYYNADLLAAANLTGTLQTRKDFEQAAAALTRKSATGNATPPEIVWSQNGFALTSDSFPSSLIFQSLVQQFGGNMFEEAGDQGVKAAFASQAGIDALTWMSNTRSLWFDPARYTQEVVALNDYQAGKLGIVWTASWQLSAVTPPLVDFTSRAAVLPNIGGKAQIWANSDQFVLPNHPLQATVTETSTTVSQAPSPTDIGSPTVLPTLPPTAGSTATAQDTGACKDAAAATLARYLVQDERTAQPEKAFPWSKIGYIPASEAVRSSPEYKQLRPQASLAQAADSFFYPPTVPGIIDTYSTIDGVVQRVMSGESSDIKSELAVAQDKVNSILAQERQRYSGGIP